MFSRVGYTIGSFSKTALPRSAHSTNPIIQMVAKRSLSFTETHSRNIVDRPELNKLLKPLKNCYVKTIADHAMTLEEGPREIYLGSQIKELRKANEEISASYRAMTCVQDFQNGLYTLSESVANAHNDPFQSTSPSFLGTPESYSKQLFKLHSEYTASGDASLIALVENEKMSAEEAFFFAFKRYCEHQQYITNPHRSLHQPRGLKLVESFIFDKKDFLDKILSYASLKGFKKGEPSFQKSSFSEEKIAFFHQKGIPLDHLLLQCRKQITTHVQKRAEATAVAVEPASQTDPDSSLTSPKIPDEKTLSSKTMKQENPLLKPIGQPKERPSLIAFPRVNEISFSLFRQLPTHLRCLSRVNPSASLWTSKYTSPPRNIERTEKARQERRERKERKERRFADNMINGTILAIGLMYLKKGVDIYQNK